MNINWRVKIVAEKVLSFIPGGYTVASWLRERLSDMDYDLSKRILKGLDNFKLLQDKTGVSFKGANVLEFGTGMTLVDPIILYFLGAARVYTFDHIPHVSEQAFRAALSQIPPHFPTITRFFDIAEVELQDRYNRVSCLRSMSEICHELGISVLQYPVESAQIEGGSIDIFFSESVLQRIPEDRLESELLSVAQLMRPNGVSFHRIDCKDINSQAAYYDKGLWPLYYLKYSDRFWNLITAQKFNSQNRLRWNEFVELLEVSGLSTIYTESIAYDEDIERLKTFSVAKRFSNFDEIDLAVQSCKLVSGKGVLREASRQPYASSWKKWIDA